MIRNKEDLLKFNFFYAVVKILRIGHLLPSRRDFRSSVETKPSRRVEPKVKRSDSQKNNRKTPFREKKNR